MGYVAFYHIDHVPDDGKHMLPDVSGHGNQHDVISGIQRPFSDLGNDIENPRAFLHGGNDVVKPRFVGFDCQLMDRRSVPRCGPHNPVMTENHSRRVKIGMALQPVDHFLYIHGIPLSMLSFFDVLTALFNYEKKCFMAKRKKQKQLLHIGEVLATAFKRKKMPVHVTDQHLSHAWDNAVGSIIAANTRAHNIKNGTLFVKVSTSTWMQQLQFMKREIMDKVNAALEKQSIKNIHFSIGDISPVIHGNEHAPPVNIDLKQLRERDRKMIEESTASLSDGELREIVKRVMIKEIINRRTRQDKQSR